jgi:hypothetical protein
MANLQQSYINCHVLLHGYQPLTDKELGDEFDRGIATHISARALELTDVQIQRAIGVVHEHRQVEGKHLPYRCAACHEDYGSYDEWLAHVIRLQFQVAAVQDGAS